MSSLPPARHEANGENSEGYRCGTLTYGKGQLAKLFFWLLWGDVCWVLMEAVVPSIIPLKLKSLGASDSFMGVMLVTVPLLIGSVLNPVISFRSDRFRSRWGRRIPFIFLSVPFLVVCLIGLGFGDAIGRWLQHFSTALANRLSPTAFSVAVIGFFLIFFSFFNTFVNSTFWYLFNDVVPERLLARFMSWFRMFGLGAGSLYSILIFPYAETHFRAILFGGGAIYFFGFGLMCLNVREGTYPPPTPNVDHSTGLISAIRTFAQECHADRFYWYLFLGSAAGACSTAVNAFMIFFYQGTGLNLTQIGRLAGTTSIVTATLIIGSGWLADRFHPMRVVLVGQCLQLFVVLPATCVWIFWHPSSDTAFLGWMILSVALVAPTAALLGVGDPPMLMRILPRQNYGQFCSANAMWRAAGGIVGGAAGGVFLDLLSRYVDHAHAYAYIPVWQFAFSIPLTILTYKLFVRWKKLGGDLHYQPPLLGVGDVLRGNVPAPPSIPGTHGIQDGAAAVIELARDQAARSHR